MKLSLRFDDNNPADRALHQDMTSLAKADGRSMNKEILAALREWVAARKTARPKRSATR